MSSCFCTKPVVPNSAPPDPSKHVNYVQGMVLGVDDFTQEFAYLSGRDRWLARDAIGYGTLRGLALSWMKDDAGKLQPKVMVTAGTALTPCGQLVCVPSSQCADINQWLAPTGRDAEITSRLEAGSRLTLHVTLAYSDCPTDDTPIPGEPCRSAEELMQPSRITDSFQLELSWDAPLQAEEDAVRGFSAWLNTITISAQAGNTIAIKQFSDAVRQWDASQNNPAALTISAVDVPRYYAVAWRIWVTELRAKADRAAAFVRFNKWLGAVPSAADGTDDENAFHAEVRRWTPHTQSWPSGMVVKDSKKDEFIAAAQGWWRTEIAPQRYDTPCNCESSPHPLARDDRLLLGTISFKVERTDHNEWSMAIPDSPSSELPTVGETQRPVLLHLRALQEQWRHAVNSSFGSIGSAVDRNVALGRVKYLDPADPNAIQETPVVGGLKVSAVSAGVVRFTFPAYAKPDGNHDYIVQVIANFTNGPSEPAVRFLEFTDTDFAYKVTRSGKNVYAKDLKAMLFQVEVTEIVKPN